MMRHRISVVLRHVLVDARMRHGPCGLGECGQQQGKGDPTSSQSRHGETGYPSRPHAHPRIDGTHLRTQAMSINGLGLALVSALLFGASTPTRASRRCSAEFA
jgi:hypothetical protein